MDACPECATNCVLIHQLKGKHGSSAVTSFFKVMFCDRYSELMFLPPKFAATVSKLVNQKISLEDSRGCRWPVTISEVDGSLAFEHGWNAFFLDHGLKLGDFIFFFYLHTHFVVKIYDRSGCEKLDFPKSNVSKKRTRSEREYEPRIEPSHSNNGNSMKNKSSSTSFSSRLSGAEEVEPLKENLQPRKGRCQEKPNDFMEDWFFLSDPVTRNKQNEDGRLLFDLSDFEKNVNNLRSNGSKRKTVENPDISRKSEVGGDKPGNKISVANKPNIGVFELNATEDTERRDAPKEPDNPCSMSDSTKRNEKNSEPLLPKPTATVAAKTRKTHTPNLGIKQREEAEETDACVTFSAPSPCRMAPAEERSKLHSNPSRTRQALKFVKIEPLEISPNLGSLQKIIPGTYGELPTLKMEPEAGNLDIVAIPLLQDDSMDVVGIARDSSCLELPSKLAASGRFRHGKKVVVLQDPRKRLWPVLYYERHDLKCLMSGWKAFYEANEIQPGDKCIFTLEDKSDCIYEVLIIREPDLLRLPAP